LTRNIAKGYQQLTKISIDPSSGYDPNFSLIKHSRNQKMGYSQSVNDLMEAGVWKPVEFTATQEEFFRKNEVEEQLTPVDVREEALFFGNEARDQYYNSYRKSSSYAKKRMTPFLEYIN